MAINLTQDDINKIEIMAGLGLTLDEIALILNISPRTLDRRIADNENVAIAYKTGRAKAKMKVTGKLFEQIEKGKIAAILFYLKTQCGWRETNKEEIEQPNIIFYLPEKD